MDGRPIRVRGTELIVRVQTRSRSMLVKGDVERAFGLFFIYANAHPAEPIGEGHIPYVWGGTKLYVTNPCGAVYNANLAKRCGQTIAHWITQNDAWGTRSFRIENTRPIHGPALVGTFQLDPNHGSSEGVNEAANVENGISALAVPASTNNLDISGDNLATTNASDTASANGRCMDIVQGENGILNFNFGQALTCVNAIAEWNQKTKDYGKRVFSVALKDDTRKDIFARLAFENALSLEVS
ncbi:uncharacterized protein KY384_005251 [Bacidia gigantensis]|uniref:uncharacterized protein n=1 Tax=Bacidia gigantensis TaxID=2732470 RepID=UPI001D04A986|nr:uncharacterized protein KY384_005251 [Bacidia gigantensis]KAG8529770.1 hypothetical protein KY384_005251 [Bacidia gigantensis]